MCNCWFSLVLYYLGIFTVQLLLALTTEFNFLPWSCWNRDDPVLRTNKNTTKGQKQQKVCLKLEVVPFIWVFPKIMVPPILIGFSIINHPFWGTPIFGNTHIHRSQTNKKHLYLREASCDFGSCLQNQRVHFLKTIQGLPTRDNFG